MRTYTLTVVLAGALGATACGQQPPPYKPVADVKGLMQGIVDPASDIVWESVATIFTKDGGEWMKRSQELIDSASAALRAAEAKNVDELYRIGGVIDEACENCHKKYWPNY